MEKKGLFIFVLLILSMSLISAVPGIPHQFYGEIEVNGEPSDDILVAFIDEQNYSTIILEGIYGIKPNTFFVEDINGDNNGKEITFYVGGGNGKKAGTYIFQSNSLTKLDFSLTTTCGDNYCLGDETCSNCEIDCGICTNPPEIIIASPENKIYNISKIDLNVYSNQNILIWMYSINSQTPQVFVPNITLTLNDGDYELHIIGINTAYQSNSKTIPFIVDIPEYYCGDGTCNNDEDCSTCPGDCGACPIPVTSSSGEGGGGGGGSFSKPKNTTNITTASQITENITQDIEKSEIEQENTNEEIEKKNFLSRITGSTILEGEGNNLFKLFLGIIVLIGILIFVFALVKIKKNKKRHYISDYH